MRLPLSTILRELSITGSDVEVLMRAAELSRLAEFPADARGAFDLVAALIGACSWLLMAADAHHAPDVELSSVDPAPSVEAVARSLRLAEKSQSSAYSVEMGMKHCLNTRLCDGMGCILGRESGYENGEARRWFVFFRREVRGPFSERDLVLAQIGIDGVLGPLSSLLLDSYSIHSPDQGDDVHRRLSPRQRDVVGLLLRGQTRKQIADCLDISLNTVVGYMKETYRLLEISSQAELFALYLNGRLDWLEVRSHSAAGEGGTVERSSRNKPPKSGGGTGG